MSQSLVKNFIHLVFSTKYREELIFPPYEEKLHAYMGGICKELDCTPIKIGGYTDHVHILCLLSKNITLVELVQKVKANSSKWIKGHHEDLEHFFWQGGYAAFSVSPYNVEKLIKYIQNQHQHHAGQSYKEEVLGLLKAQDMEYDERYLWD